MTFEQWKELIPIVFGQLTILDRGEVNYRVAIAHRNNLTTAGPAFRGLHPEYAGNQFCGIWAALALRIVSLQQFQSGFQCHC